MSDIETAFADNRKIQVPPIPSKAEVDMQISMVVSKEDEDPDKAIKAKLSELGGFSGVKTKEELRSFASWMLDFFSNYFRKQKGIRQLEKIFPETIEKIFAEVSQEIKKISEGDSPKEISVEEIESMREEFLQNCTRSLDFPMTDENIGLAKSFAQRTNLKLHTFDDISAVIESLNFLYSKRQSGEDVEEFLTKLDSQDYGEYYNKSFAKKLEFDRQITEQGRVNLELIRDLTLGTSGYESASEYNEFDPEILQGLSDLRKIGIVLDLHFIDLREYQKKVSVEDIRAFGEMFGDLGHEQALSWYSQLVGFSEKVKKITPIGREAARLIFKKTNTRTFYFLENNAEFLNQLNAQGLDALGEVCNSASEDLEFYKYHPGMLNTLGATGTRNFIILKEVPFSKSDEENIKFISEISLEQAQCIRSLVGNHQNNYQFINFGDFRNLDPKDLALLSADRLNSLYSVYEALPELNPEKNEKAYGSSLNGILETLRGIESVDLSVDDFQKNIAHISRDHGIGGSNKLVWDWILFSRGGYKLYLEAFGQDEDPYCKANCDFLRSKSPEDLKNALFDEANYYLYSMELEMFNRLNASPNDLRCGIVNLFQNEAISQTDRLFLGKWLLDRETDFGKFYKNGNLTTDFFETFNASSFVRTEIVESLLTSEAISTFPSEKQNFWKYFARQENGDYRSWLLEKAKSVTNFYENPENFENTYSEFILDRTVRPERIRRWETLTQVFQELEGIGDHLAKAEAYLRIAEALSVSPLTSRTEVESLNGMQVAFCSLYRKDMDDYERRTWNLLKKQLPFATDERIREDMRNQALVVEAFSSNMLSWVHQAIHNYVLPQAPEYMRALRDYAKEGGSDQETKLRTIASRYTVDSRPSENFFSAENRFVLEIAMPEIEKLVTLTEGYYEISTEKIIQLANSVEQICLSANLQDHAGLRQKLFGDFSRMKEIFSNKMDAENGENIIIFLTKISSLKKSLLELASLAGGDVKNDVLSLDSALTHSHKVYLADYLNNYFSRKLSENSLNNQDLSDFLHILKNALIAGKLEGEITGFEHSIGFIERELGASSVRENFEITPLFIQAAGLLLAKDRLEMLDDWRGFNEFSQMNLVGMLKRMGMDENEAIGQVIMNDLVRFEKSSYKFSLDPMLDMFIKNTGRIRAASAEAIIETDVSKLYKKELGEKTFEGGKTGNAEVDQYLASLSIGKMPSTLEGANDFLKNIESLPEMQADKLCQLLVKGYFNDNKTAKRHTSLEMQGRKIEFYPFSLYGADGVIITIDEKRVENPLEEMKKIYAGSIVPSMIRSLREGD
jgi:hypothetical protein